MGNVILTGFMGSGKSSVAIKLSYRLKKSVVDTDKVIEKKQGKTITQIFEQDGEDAFRQMETDTLRSLKESSRNDIISVGGGTPMREENRALLKEIGTVVYLRVKPETVFERVKADGTRPLLNCEDPQGKIRELLEKRDPLYTDGAHVIVDVDDKNFGQILFEIERAVRSREMELRAKRQEGFKKEGFQREGFNREGYKEGFQRDGYRRDFRKDGYNKDGYNRENYNKEGYNKENYNKDGQENGAAGYGQRRYDGQRRYGERTYGERTYGDRNFGFNGFRRFGNAAAGAAQDGSENVGAENAAAENAAAENKSGVSQHAQNIQFALNDAQRQDRWQRRSWQGYGARVQEEADQAENEENVNQQVAEEENIVIAAAENGENTAAGAEMTAEAANAAEAVAAEGEAAVTSENAAETAEGGENAAESACAAAKTASGRKRLTKLLVINGPNLNFLGIREKGVYGTQDYNYLLNLIAQKGLECGVAIEVYQSNHEGAIIDKLQAAYFDGTDGIVINPGAYTHYSYAIRDALASITVPKVEVHISNIMEREPFRRVSVTAPVCDKQIYGQGLDGYLQAIDFILDFKKNS